MKQGNGLFRSLAVTAIELQVPGVKTFHLAAADGVDMEYSAGQFLTLAFNINDTEFRRSYSFSSCPHIDSAPAITVKRVDNGACSRFLIDTIKVGDTLNSIGTFGFYTLPANINQYNQVFFFAAGIGITPVLPLIKALLHFHPHIHIVLVYSNSSISTTAFYDQLIHLSAEFNGRLKIVYLFSSSFDLTRARLNKYLVKSLVRENSTSPHSSALFYLCGPFAYMRMVVYALEEIGIPTHQIRREQFNTHRTETQQNLPPDFGTHMVTIHSHNTTTTIPVTYPNTILQAAKKYGLDLPFSCETGRCGSCAARCISGKVWHSYNEVLMDIELQNGSILTCTGYPMSDTVEIVV
jgi:ferredoxin-NADP reductase